MGLTASQRDKQQGDQVSLVSLHWQRGKVNIKEGWRKFLALCLGQIRVINNAWHLEDIILSEVSQTQKD